MKNIKRLFIFICLTFFGSSAFLLEGIAVIDYQAIFTQTELAKERIDEATESPDFKDLQDEGVEKQNERIKLVEKFQKDESTLSDSEKNEISKKIQNLTQSVQLISQQLAAKNQELLQELQNEQLQVVNKVVEEIIKAKKIKLVITNQAVLAFDRNDENLNITPQVIEAVNKEQKK